MSIEWLNAYHHRAIDMDAKMVKKIGHSIGWQVRPRTNPTIMYLHQKNTSQDSFNIQFEQDILIYCIHSRLQRQHVTYILNFHNHIWHNATILTRKLSTALHIGNYVIESVPFYGITWLLFWLNLSSHATYHVIATECKIISIISLMFAYLSQKVGHIKADMVWGYQFQFIIPNNPLTPKYPCVSDQIELKMFPNEDCMFHSIWFRFITIDFPVTRHIVTLTAQYDALSIDQCHWYSISIISSQYVFYQSYVIMCFWSGHVDRCYTQI